MIRRPSPRPLREILQGLHPTPSPPSSSFPTPTSISQDTTPLLLTTLSTWIQRFKDIHHLPELYSRHLIPSPSSPQSSLQPSSSKIFRIMQFNLLAEGLSAPPENESIPFPDLKRKEGDYGGFDIDEDCHLVFDFKIRQWRLLEEILRSLPDVLAVEECDHFDDFFFPILQSLGFSVLLSSFPSPRLRLLTSPREDFNRKLPHPVLTSVTTVTVWPFSGGMKSLKKWILLSSHPLTPLISLLHPIPPPLSPPFSLIALPTNLSTSSPLI